MRLVFGLLLTLTLFGCSPLHLERQSDPFGDFRLGHIAVYGEEITKGPLSREATDDERRWRSQKKKRERNVPTQFAITLRIAEVEFICNGSQVRSHQVLIGE